MLLWQLIVLQLLVLIAEAFADALWNNLRPAVLVSTQIKVDCYQQ